MGGTVPNPDQLGRLCPCQIEIGAWLPSPRTTATPRWPEHRPMLVTTGYGLVVANSNEPTSPDFLASDHLLAATLAERTGQILLDLRASLVADGAATDELKAHGDRTAHEFIMGALAELRPGDAAFSEEGIADESDDARGRRVSVSRVWVIDPLDGTREFGEPERGDWAVHVAMCVDGLPVVGAVALPAMGLVLSTAQPPRLPDVDPSRETAPRIVVSRSRPPSEATVIRDALDGELVTMGSAGAKAMAVVRGEVDIYPHSGGQYEWDNCAPAAVALAAGLVATRLDGSPLIYNRPDPYLPDLLICRREWATSVATALGH